MSIDSLRLNIKDFAKDIRLNLGSVMSEEGSPDLTLEQINAIALSCAYATKNPDVISACEAELSEEIKNAAKSAASIMAMNNIYYRFTHFVSDPEYAKMPAKLRMNVIGNPGISKVDFELMSLAVSAINGCGLCVDSHSKHLVEAGISKSGIQSCIRIAAVINATAQALVLS